MDVSVPLTADASAAKNAGTTSGKKRSAAVSGIDADVATVSAGAQVPLSALAKWPLRKLSEADMAYLATHARDFHARFDVARKNKVCTFCVAPMQPGSGKHECFEKKRYYEAHYTKRGGKRDAADSAGGAPNKKQSPPPQQPQPQYLTPQNEEEARLINNMLMETRAKK
jgi:hypothetical protein